MLHEDRHARAIYGLVDADIVIMRINKNVPRDMLCGLFFIEDIIKHDREIFNGSLARGEFESYLIDIPFNLRADILISEKMQFIIIYPFPRSMKILRGEKNCLNSSNID